MTGSSSFRNILTSVAVAALAHASSAQCDFWGARQFAALATETQYAVAADLNRDGKLDVVTSRFELLAGDGLGGLAAPVSLPVPSNYLAAGWLVVGDWNGDGSLDVAFGCTTTGQQSSALLVYLAQAGGPSAPSVEVLQPGKYFYDLESSDIDGDGDLDIVALTTSFGWTYLATFLGDGAGSFGSPLHVPLGNLAATDMALGHFDADALTDVALAVDNLSPFGPWDYLYVLHGDGLGGFPLLGYVGPNDNASVVTADDFDGDGLDDLALLLPGGSSNSVRVLRGTGAGGFQPPTDQDVSFDLTRLVGADLDGDHDVDLVALSVQGASPAVLQNSGAGMFASPVSLEWPWARELVVGRFDGDTWPDVVTCNFPFPTLTMRISDGVGGFRAARSIPLYGRWLAAGDFDRDGIVDVASAGAAPSTTQLAIGDGVGSFAPLPAFATPSALDGASGDLNGDQNLDLVLANGLSAAVLLGDGSGGFAAPASVNAGSACVGVELGDLTGDGVLDLISMSEDNGPGTQSVLWVCTGNGDGMFGAPVGYNSFPYPKAAAVGDFDGNGRNDIALLHRSDTRCRVYLFPTSGGAPTVTNIQLGPGSQYAIDAADIDADGDLDLIVSRRNSNVPSFVSVLRGNGAGAFAAPVNYTLVGGQAAGLNVADLDGDGVLDIAAISGALDNVSVLFGDASGGFAPAAAFATHSQALTGAHGLVSVDANLDGRPDLIVASDLLLNLGQQATTGAYCTAKTSSIGCVPEIGWSGVPSASASSGFLVSAADAVNQKPGLLFYGLNGSRAAAFAGGLNCVAPPVRRGLIAYSSGSALPALDCSGVYSIDLNAFASGALGGSPDPALAVAGAHVHCQWWGRDVGAPPNNTQLSTALQYVVGP